jgi:thioesterase domain-containing protein
MRVKVFQKTAAKLNILPRDISFMNRIASHAYTPPFYPGKVTLFRIQERPDYIRTDPTEGWQRYATTLEVHDVPGDHATLLNEPHIRTLADEVKKCLQEAQVDQIAKR